MVGGSICVYSSRSLQICPLINRNHSESRCSERLRAPEPRFRTLRRGACRPAGEAAVRAAGSERRVAAPAWAAQPAHPAARCAATVRRWRRPWGEWLGRGICAASSAVLRTSRITLMKERQINPFPSLVLPIGPGSSATPSVPREATAGWWC